ncbi:MAG: hypothetical protein DI551_12440, partial [Micavibrio aeruginosavorus]
QIEWFDKLTKGSEHFYIDDDFTVTMDLKLTENGKIVRMLGIENFRGEISAGEASRFKVIAAPPVNPRF